MLASNLLTAIFILVLTAIPGFSVAKEGVRVAFLVENSSVNELANLIGKSGDYDYFVTEDVSSIGPGHVLVAIGDGSFRCALEYSGAYDTVIAAFVSASTAMSAYKDGIQAISGDVSAAALSSFLSIQTDWRSVAYIYDDVDEPYIASLVELLSASRVTIEPIKATTKPFSDLRAVAETGADAVFLSSNTAVHNPRDIKLKLESLFRQQLPVVSSRKSLVKRGALVSVYPNELQVVALTQRAISLAIEAPQAELFDPFVEGFEIEFNPYLSDFYNVSFGAEDDI